MIVHPLASVKLTEEQITKVEYVRGLLVHAYDVLTGELPNGRLKSLALTALETCTLWAIKAIAHDGA